MKQNFYISLLSLILFLFPVKPSFAEEKNAGSSAQLATQSGEISYDARTKILRGFLESYDSPLAKNAETFVKSADEYSLDYRFVAAISGVESTFGKELPNNSYNAWGWGIYGDNIIYFSSYSEAIKTISKALREQYINTWKAENVYQIGKLYAQSPTWAQRVVYFMNKVDQFESQKKAYTLPISL